MSSNIVPQIHSVQLEDRIARNKYRPHLIWFTGLSGSGKSTLANEVEKKFFTEGVNTYILDGDNIRGGLNSDLDFSDHGRVENIRRISEVSKLFVDAGCVVLTAFISPFIKDRQTAREIVGEDYFTEVFVDCPLEECERRDVKGLYKKARAGEIPFFTGISSPFEEPKNANVHVDTLNEKLDESLRKILDHVEPKILKD